MRLVRGTILVAALDPTTGHEQRGRRPCVAVSNPDVASHQRFPLICLVPLTSTPGTGALYPAVEGGPGSGLRKRSYAMVDQIRSVDKTRVLGVMGRVTDLELEALDLGIRLFLAL